MGLSASKELDKHATTIELVRKNRENATRLIVRMLDDGQTGLSIALTGQMYGGKTTTLISLWNYMAANAKRVVLICHEDDKRYDKRIGFTRSLAGLTSPCVRLRRAVDVARMCTEQSVGLVLWDEAHLFGSAAEVWTAISLIKSRGRNVVFTFPKSHFGTVSKLPTYLLKDYAQPTTHVFEFLSVCDNCGIRIATESARISPAPVDVDNPSAWIGAKESYKALCYDCAAHTKK